MTGVVDANLVVTTLHAFIRDELPGVQVLDGWDRVTELEEQTLAVGQPPAMGGASFTVATAPDEGGFCAQKHDVTVRCSAAAWDGDSEYPLKRGLVQDMLTKIQKALDADPTLGGVAYEAWVATGQQWYQVGDAKGTTVQCDFAVTARVFG